MFSTEEWKDWKFNDLYYLVSNTGKIIGKHRKKELLQRKNKDGYLVVSVGCFHNRVTKRMHRIVAELTNKSVIEIKNLIKIEKSNRKIAKMYGVKDSTIWNIGVENTWKDI